MILIRASRRFAFAAIGVSAMALSACATEEGYRQHMSMEMGRASDDIMMRWGPPQNRSSMSNGREMWSYTKTTVDEQDGYYRDETRQVKRTFTDKDGKQKTETITVLAQDSYEERVYHEILTPKNGRMANLLDLFSTL